MNNAVPAQHTFATRTGGSSCSTRGRALYNAALEYARQEQYDIARRAFEKTVTECPGFVKPWVSWAQASGRAAGRAVNLHTAPRAQQRAGC
jgi:hypothetical protein